MSKWFVDQRGCPRVWLIPVVGFALPPIGYLGLWLIATLMHWLMVQLPLPTFDDARGSAPAPTATAPAGPSATVTGPEAAPPRP